MKYVYEVTGKTIINGYEITESRLSKPTTAGRIEAVIRRALKKLIGG